MILKSIFLPACEGSSFTPDCSRFGILFVVIPPLINNRKHPQRLAAIFVYLLSPDCFA